MKKLIVIISLVSTCILGQAQTNQNILYGIYTTLDPQNWIYGYVDINSPEYTQMTVYATNYTTTGLVNLYVNFDSMPTLTGINEVGPVGLTNSDLLETGNSITVDSPTPGRYWIGLYNESATPQTVYGIAKLYWESVPEPTFAAIGCCAFALVGLRRFMRC